MAAPGPNHETYKRMTKNGKIFYWISIAAGLGFTLYVMLGGSFK